MTEGPPPDRIPGVAVLRELVAQAPDAAVLLLEARGYSQGCLLEFAAVARPAAGAGSPVLGVDFGAGVHPLEGWHAERAVRRLPDEVAATDRSTGIRVRLWLAPLPPAEGVDLVVDWPERGIHGQRWRFATDGARYAAFESFPCLPA
jgi:hypothetical protein